MNAPEAILQWLVFLVCVGLAYAATARIKRPEQPLVWVALCAAALIVSFVGLDLPLLSVSGATVYLNTPLQGLGIGLLLGFLIRRTTEQDGSA